MTTVTADFISNVGLLPGPNDYVAVYRKTLGFNADGEVVTTQRREYSIASGKLRISDLQPGDNYVYVHCGEWQDEYRMLTPDSGEYTLWDLIEPFRHYPGSAVQAAQKAAAQARASAAAAAAFAQAASDYRDDARALDNHIHDVDIPHIDAQKAHIDGQVAAIDTAFTDSIPPYLQPDSPTGLKATYATVGEVRSRAKADGSDQTATLQGEIDALCAAGGGRLILPSGTIRIDGRIIMPYTLDSHGAPVQATVYVIGQGCVKHGRGSGVPLVPTGGTVLDMRWNGDPAKARWFSGGFGYMELTGLTFMDGGSTNTAGVRSPFFKHTCTTVYIHDISGMTNQARGNCGTDLIVAGGRTIPTGGDFSLDEDAPFQGYGSVYERIWHNGIRYALDGGAFFNQTTIEDVVGWQDSGNTNGGSIRLDPGTDPKSQMVCGVNITNVLAESLAYKFGIELRKVSRSNLSNIGSYDYSGATGYVSAIRVDQCGGINVLAGYDDRDGTHPYITAPEGQFWQDQVLLIEGGFGPNSPGTTISGRLSAWNGAVLRGLQGDDKPLKFARPADAASGNQVGFSANGRTWGFVDGPGAGMLIDTGTGGSYFDVRAYRHRFYSHTGGQYATVGTDLEVVADGGGLIMKDANGKRWKATPKTDGSGFTLTAV